MSERKLDTTGAPIPPSEELEEAMESHQESEQESENGASPADHFSDTGSARARRLQPRRQRRSRLRIRGK